MTMFVSEVSPEELTPEEEAHMEEHVAVEDEIRQLLLDSFPDLVCQTESLLEVLADCLTRMDNVAEVHHVLSAMLALATDRWTKDLALMASVGNA